MPEPEESDGIQTNLRAHPAVVAWSRLQPEQVEPEGIAVLRRFRFKSAVYRLDGVGLGGSAVIAKRSRTTVAEIERAIYEDILPQLPVPCLHYYGSVAHDELSCWLFLEDAGGEHYSHLHKEHRALAAQWLGMMHTSAALVPAAQHLPDRGPGHYLDHLRSARNTIQLNLANPALTPDDLAVLESIVFQCDGMESTWHQVEELCEGVPKTVVHGDLKNKNMRVRPGRSGPLLLAFDWEMAGWGVPAADLWREDASAYWLSVREHWPRVGLEAVQRLVAAGRLFRWLAAINWQAQSLPYAWIETPMEKMRLYLARLIDAIQAIENMRSRL